MLKDDSWFSEPKTRLGRLWWQFRMRLVFGIFHGLMQLITLPLRLIRWLLVPFVLLFNLLILVPLARWQLRSPLAPAFQRVKAEDLPAWVWRTLEIVALDLQGHDFSKGEYALGKDLAPKHRFYVLSMVHTERKLGVGINLGYADLGQTEEQEDPPAYNLSLEFSLEDRTGRIVDLTNNPQPDPFPHPRGKGQRWHLPDLGHLDLFRLARRYSREIQGQTAETALTRLQQDLPGLMNEEYRTFTGKGLADGLLWQKGDHYRLTWLGALTSALRTTWPSRQWLANWDYRKARLHFAQLDIDLTDYEWLAVETAQDEEEALATMPATLAEALVLAHDRVKRRLDPTAVLVSLQIILATDGQAMQSLQLGYEARHDFPLHRSRGLASTEVTFVWEKAILSVLEPERQIYSYQQWEAYGLRARRPLPATLDGLVPWAVANRSLQAEWQRRGQAADFHGIELTVRQERLYWVGRPLATAGAVHDALTYGFAEDGDEADPSALAVDAITGELC